MMRIVYVEDNQANVFLVKRVARMGGHDIINYIDGEEALTHIQRDDPHLILMDIQLAGDLSGLQVVEKLRGDGFNRPIIAVTAYAMVGDRERCLAAGCNDYIAKPLSIPRLIELIDHYNDQSGSPATSIKRKTSELPGVPPPLSVVILDRPEVQPAAPAIVTPSPATATPEESAPQPAPGVVAEPAQTSAIAPQSVAPLAQPQDTTPAEPAEVARPATAASDTELSQPAPAVPQALSPAAADQQPARDVDQPDETEAEPTLDTDAVTSPTAEAVSMNEAEVRQDS